MTDGTSLPVVVRLPARVDPRMRLGPFRSARDALKFLAYAAVGATVGAATGALAWLPFVGAGLIVALYQPEGRPLDERLIDLLRYRWRARRPGPGAPGAPAPPGGDRLAVVAPGFLVGVLASEGVPVAYRPPRDARRLFEGFRGVLRDSGPGVYLLASGDPIRLGLPSGVPPGANELERSAQLGYREMVRLLFAHRLRRTVFVVLWEEAAGPAEVGRLERRLGTVAAGLASIGISPERLRGASLARALRKLNLPTVGGGRRGT